MNKVTTKQFLIVSLMLFSLFFGSGNLIFAPMTGKMAGESMLLTMTFFSVTSILLPLMGVIAVAKSNGLENLSGKVSPWFAVVFTIVIYLSIGPIMGVPRAGSTPFEMVIAPKIADDIWSQVALFIYTLLFFGVTYWVALNPKKMASTVGKYLTPGIIILMLGLFIASLFRPLGDYAPAIGVYAETPAIQGFLDGYMTMDTMGALNFGLVIAMSIRAFNISNEKHIEKTTIKAGIIAGLILMVIYFMLAHLGAQSASAYPDTTNGAQILALTSEHILGDFGLYLMGAMFTLACLTTSIGLISSCSHYFANHFSKLSYKAWVGVWTLLSLVLANVGLDTILVYNKPLLTAFYPMAILLILICMVDHFLTNKRLVYKLTIYTTGVICIIDALGELNLRIPFLTDLIGKLPLSDLHLNWVIPAAICFALSMFIGVFIKEKKAVN